MLKNRGIWFDEIAIKVTHAQKFSSDGAISSKWAATPRAMEVIELATTTCRELGQNDVGTEHLLLGLLPQEHGMAGVILRQFITADEFRAELQNHGTDRTMEDLDQEQHILHLIRTAFAGVVLGNGVGLRQRQGLDDYADARTLASYRAQDEKQDWSAIPATDLDRYYSSLSFFDAGGMRFYLPA